MNYRIAKDEQEAYESGRVARGAGLSVKASQHAHPSRLDSWFRCGWHEKDQEIESVVSQAKIKRRRIFRSAANG